MLLTELAAMRLDREDVTLLSQGGSNNKSKSL